MRPVSVPAKAGGRPPEAGPRPVYGRRSDANSLGHLSDRGGRVVSYQPGRRQLARPSVDRSPPPVPACPHLFVGQAVTPPDQCHSGVREPADLGYPSIGPLRERVQERARCLSALPPAQRFAVLNIGLDGQHHRFGALAGEQHRLDVGTTGLPERLEAVHAVDDGHGALVLSRAAEGRAPPSTRRRDWCPLSFREASNQWRAPPPVMCGPRQPGAVVRLLIRLGGGG